MMLYALIFGAGCLVGCIATCLFLILSSRPLTAAEAERQVIDLCWDHPEICFQVTRKPS